MSLPENLYSDNELIFLKGASRKVATDGGLFWMGQFKNIPVLILRTKKTAKKAAALVAAAKKMRQHITNNVPDLKNVKPTYVVQGEVTWNEGDSCLDFHGDGNHPQFKKKVRALVKAYSLGGLKKVRLVNNETDEDNLHRDEDPDELTKEELEVLNKADTDWDKKDKAVYEQLVADELADLGDDIQALKRLLPPVNQDLVKMAQPDVYEDLDEMLEMAQTHLDNWAPYPVADCIPGYNTKIPRKRRPPRPFDFLTYIKAFAAETNGDCTTNQAHALKSEESAKRKEKLKGDCSKICDLVRATVVYDDGEEAPTKDKDESEEAFEIRMNEWVENESSIGKIKKAIEKAQERFDVVRIKNRLRAITSAGYGDVMISIRAPGADTRGGKMICELQLQPKLLASLKNQKVSDKDKEYLEKLPLQQQVDEMLNYLKKQSGHGLYDMIRTIAKGRALGDIKDKVERARVQRLLMESQAFYAKAMEPLTSKAYNVYLIEDIEAIARTKSKFR